MDKDYIAIEILKLQIQSRGANFSTTTAAKLIDEFVSIKKLLDEKLGGKQGAFTGEN